VGQAPDEMPQVGAGGGMPAGDQTSEDSAGEPSGGIEQFDAVYVKKLRAEAADYRRRLRELEARVKAEDDRKLTESERMARRVAELEREQTEYLAERQERVVRYEVMLAASKLNIVDPDAAFRLIDLANLEFDEDGMPKNLDKALKELVKARPYLVKQAATQSINAGDGIGAGGKTAVDPKAREAELRRRFRISAAGG
jgi:hypothetical protein